MFTSSGVFRCAIVLDCHLDSWVSIGIRCSRLGHVAEQAEACGMALAMAHVLSWSTGSMVSDSSILHESGSHSSATWSL